MNIPVEWRAFFGAFSAGMLVAAVVLIYLGFFAAPFRGLDLSVSVTVAPASPSPDGNPVVYCCWLPVLAIVAIVALIALCHHSRHRRRG
jgi:hypothetical protein